MPQINPSMITLAREARSLTQLDLGGKLQLHKANISRLENGETNTSEETLLAISNITNYPPQFFFQKGEILPANLSYRKREHVAAKIINPIDAQINIITRHTQFITQVMNVTPLTLPIYEVTENRTPADIALLVRKKWNIKEAVIQNLIRLLENNGIIINSFQFNTDRVDSRCMITEDKIPIIFLNKSLLGDRQRFSLAFELGHLIMHTFCNVPHQRDINHEANLFAAAFLMPAKEIINDFKQDITLPLLGELKTKWKVSMIALLYRADDLGFLTPNQKRYIVQQFNQQNIRKREPQQLDITAEKPERMRQLLSNYITKTKFTISQMCTLLSTEQDDYIAYYST
jgi:Zn-dependent peptidase ImmA (M78 family)/DNA-binding XRE family transcriptional regulator